MHVTHTRPRSGSKGSRVQQRADVAVAPGKTDLGAAQVTVFVKAIDAFDIASVVSVIGASPADARDLARRLLEAADAAERL